MRLDWLGSPRLTWRDLLVIVKEAPPDSAIVRSVDPQQAAWGVQEHLLARMVEAVEILAWFNSEDGQKNRNRPERIERPGVTPDRRSEGNQFGTTLRSLEETAAWLATRNPNQHAQGGTNA